MMIGAEVSLPLADLGTYPVRSGRGKVAKGKATGRLLELERSLVRVQAQALRACYFGYLKLFQWKGKLAPRAPRLGGKLAAAQAAKCAECSIEGQIGRAHV